MLLLLLLAGCPSTTLPAGATCEDAAECDEGLDCLPFSVFEGDTCEDVGTMCTVSCETDDDCAAAGDGYLCFATCDGGMSCAATG